jgi:hypothetical protein
MRTLIFILIVLLTSNFKAFSQKDSLVVLDNYVQDIPRFPGGYDSLWCVLENNFRYEILNKDNRNIIFNVIFVIDSLGVSKNFRYAGTRPRDIILNKSDSLKIQEIIRVLSLLPKWEPAKLMNKGINIWFSIPIKTPYTEFRCKK